MTYRYGYRFGYRDPLQFVGGATLEEVAAESKRLPTHRGWRVAGRWGTSDEVALDWIRRAQEAGLDVGMPRDKREK